MTARQATLAGIRYRVHQIFGTPERNISRIDVLWLLRDIEWLEQLIPTAEELAAFDGQVESSAWLQRVHDALDDPQMW